MSQTELYTFTWDATHFHGADLIPLFCSSPRDCPNIKILRVYQQRMWNKIKRRPDGAPNWTILPCCGICLCFMTELNSSNYQLIILSERGIIESWQVRYVLRTIFHVWQPLWVRTMLLQIIWCGGLRGHDYSVTLLFGFIIIKLNSTNTWLIKYNYNRLSRNQFSRENTSWWKSTRLRSGRIWIWILNLWSIIDSKIIHLLRETMHGM